MSELHTVESLDRQPFKYMVATIGNLPTSFVDSMSYYELLAWLCQYLEKTVIPAIDNNAEALEELQAKYIELKAYVDNYFENLDVQEEINNKLDAMAEDGTLTEIVTSYLNVKCILSYDTVEDMKNATNLIDGSFAETYGFYSKNDNGGAKYKIRTITNQDVVDNITIISLTNDNTLIAEFIPQHGKINLKQFGCHGDGETDDSSNIQKAINYVLSNEHLTLYAPRATYIVNTGITIHTSSDITYQPIKIDFSEADFSTDQLITMFDIRGGWLNIDFGRLNQTNYNASSTGILFSGYNWHEKIKVETIFGFTYGIKIIPNQGTNKGMMYTYLQWSYMNNQYNFYCDVANSYVNQNEFTGGLVGGGSGHYGVYVINSESEPSRWNFNNNIFRNVGFETCQYPIHLENCACSTFKDFRFMEDQESDTWIYVHDCECMLFESQATTAFTSTSLISDNNTTDYDKLNRWKKTCNIYRFPIGFNSSALNAFYAKETTFVNNQPVFIEGFRNSGHGHYLEPSDDPITLSPSYLANNIYCYVGQAKDTTIILPVQNSLLDINNYLNEISLRIRNLPNTNKVVIKDYNNNVIFDSSNYYATGDYGNQNHYFNIKLNGYENNNWTVTKIS